METSFKLSKLNLKDFINLLKRDIDNCYKSNAILSEDDLVRFLTARLCYAITSMIQEMDIDQQEINLKSQSVDQIVTTTLIHALMPDVGYLFGISRDIQFVSTHYNFKNDPLKIKRQRNFCKNMNIEVDKIKKNACIELAEYFGRYLVCDHNCDNQKLQLEINKNEIFQFFYLYRHLFSNQDEDISNDLDANSLISQEIDVTHIKKYFGDAYEKLLYIKDILMKERAQLNKNPNLWIDIAKPIFQDFLRMKNNIHDVLIEIKKLPPKQIRIIKINEKSYIELTIFKYNKKIKELDRLFCVMKNKFRKNETKVAQSKFEYIESLNDLLIELINTDNYYKLLSNNDNSMDEAYQGVYENRIKERVTFCDHLDKIEKFHLEMKRLYLSENSYHSFLILARFSKELINLSNEIIKLDELIQNERLNDLNTIERDIRTRKLYKRHLNLLIYIRDELVRLREEEVNLHRNYFKKMSALIGSEQDVIELNLAISSICNINRTLCHDENVIRMLIDHVHNVVMPAYNFSYTLLDYELPPTRIYSMLIEIYFNTSKLEKDFS